MDANLCEKCICLIGVPSLEYVQATVLTKNRLFKNWNTVFPNATSIATLLDRLTHHADVTLFEGQSYRMRESEMEAAARKKTK